MLRDADLVERSRVVMEKPFGTDLDSAIDAQRPGARDLPTRGRSSGSTTSWARRRRRTSWRSASPTGCSSRSGTATSSTTSRSTSPRRSASTGGPASTRRPAPTRTWSSPTCSRCWRSSRWSRRPRWSRGRSARRRTRSSARCCRSTRPTSCAASTRGYRDEDGRRAATPTPRRSSPCKCGIDNWRWAGVPFYLRTGKRMAEGAADHLDRLQGGAADDVPGRLRRRRAGPGPPDLRPGRRVQGVAVVLRQAARARA